MFKRLFSVAVLLAAGSISASAQTEDWTACAIQRVVSPDHGIAVSCNSSLPHALSVDLVRTDGVAELRGKSAVEQRVTLHVRLVRLDTGEQNWARYRYSALLQAVPIGYYRARFTGGPHVYGDDALVDVTSVGVMAISAANKRFIMPVRLAGFASAAVQVKTVDGTVLLGHDGLYDVTDVGQAVYAQAADGSIASEMPATYGGSAQRTEFVQTDRGLYRAGDTVHMRLVRRDGTISTYRLPKTDATVFVTDPGGHRIATRTVSYDGFGTASFDVPLPADATLGTYQIMDGDWPTGSFNVEAYKKPEYELSLRPKQRFVLQSQASAVDVNARYFFGRPAAGMTLQYRVQIDPRWFWYEPFPAQDTDNDGYQSYDGVLTADAAGNARIEIPAQPRSARTRVVNVSVDGRDASGRTVSASTQFEITPASFSLSVEPDQWFATINHQMNVAIRTQRYDGKPLTSARITLRFFELRRDSGTVQKTPFAVREVVTDSHGTARYPFLSDRAGEFFVDASGVDEHGLQAVSSAELWILEGTQAPWYSGNMLIVPQVSQARGGSDVRVMIVAPKNDRDVVLIAGTDEVTTHQVLHPQGNCLMVTVHVPSRATRLSLSAFQAGDNGVTQGQVQLSVESAARLHIAVTADKQRYQPGERAHFLLKITDDQGRPVRAQASVGIVDNAIYAMEEDRFDPLEALYGRSLYAYGSASFAGANDNPDPGRALMTIAHVTTRSAGNLIKAGSTSDLYSIASSSENGVAQGALRTNFRDTAYWSPSVITDGRGQAEVTMRWPDDLTTWRLTAVALTADTLVGKAAANALVTKDFLVRLETPRFLRAGDRAAITGIAHGMSDARNVRLSLDRGILGARVDSSLTLGTSLDASTTWDIGAPGIGVAQLALRGTDEHRYDGMQVSLPLLPATALLHARSGGLLKDTVDLRPVLGPGELAGNITVAIAPSIRAELAESLQVFDVYPYYCTEQTGSRAIVAALYLRTNPRGARAEHARSVLRQAHKRYEELQHGDGGFGWWEHDDTLPELTAYALETMATMRDGGYDYPQDEIARARASLEQQLAKINNDDQRAFALYALAHAGGSVSEQEYRAEMRALDGAGPQALAYAGLLALRQHDNASAQHATALLVREMRRAGGGAFWESRGGWNWEFSSDPIAITGRVVELLAQTQHDDASTADAVRFLRDMRGGSWWYSTLDTANALRGLAAYEGSNAGDAAQATVRLYAGDRLLKTMRVDTNTDAAALHTVVTPGDLHGEPLRIERDGSSIVYWDADVQRYADVHAATQSDASAGLLARLFAKPPALSVTRTYRVDHAGPWRVGDAIHVHVHVSAASKDVRYIAIEDPYPAGAEYQAEQGQGAVSWSGEQFLDDRATFFIDWLWDGGADIEYTLRATTRGTYTAPAPSAYAVYGPPVKSVGRSETIAVR